MKKILCLIFCLIASLHTQGCSPAEDTAVQSEVRLYAFFVDNETVKVSGVQKSVDDFINELKLQQGAGLKIQLMVAGNSHQEKEVTELASRLETELNIKHVGLILESK